MALQVFSEQMAKTICYRCKGVAIVCDGASVCLCQSQVRVAIREWECAKCNGVEGHDRVSK